MGAVQKLATVVIIGLTGLATLLVFLLADEPDRRERELTEQEEVAIARGIDTYIANCLACHGPAGEGVYEVDENGDPLRVGQAIGGNTPQRLINQSDDPVVRAEREQFIRYRIHAGSPAGCGTLFPALPCAMPPWGEDYGGELNDEQIEELVLMIQNVDWDLVYNEAIEASGGYPTPPVEPEATEEGGGGGDGGGTTALRLEAYDIGWRTADQAGPQVELTVAPGAVIDVVNTGAAQHNFDAPDLGLFLDLPPGASGQVTIPADATPGTYDFLCSIPGHATAGMLGTITIDPNAAGGEAPPAGEATPPPAGTPTDGGPAGGDAGAVAEEITLEAYDIGWRTADQPGPQVELTVAPGTVIELVNVGAAEHDFSLDDRNNEGVPNLGIDVNMPVGFAGTVEIPADAQPGTYYFYCDVPGHEAAGMYGTIIVQ